MNKFKKIFLLACVIFSASHVCVASESSGESSQRGRLCEIWTTINAKNETALSRTKRLEEMKKSYFHRAAPWLIGFCIGFSSNSLSNYRTSSKRNFLKKGTAGALAGCAYKGGMMGVEWFAKSIDKSVFADQMSKHETKLSALLKDSSFQQDDKNYLRYLQTEVKRAQKSREPLKSLLGPSQWSHRNKKQSK